MRREAPGGGRDHDDDVGMCRVGGWWWEKESEKMGWRIELTDGWAQRGVGDEEGTRAQRTREPGKQRRTDRTGR